MEIISNKFGMNIQHNRAEIVLLDESRNESVPMDSACLEDLANPL